MEQTLTTILVAELTGLEKTGDTGGGISDKILKDHLVTVDRIVTEHHGKLLGNAGGSLAAQFSSPSDAVRCAVVLEKTFHASAGDQSIHIGIDQGDVAIENGRVRGDGIKSASELQKRFEGIVISRAVQDQLRDDHGVLTEELGEGSDGAYRVRAKDIRINAAAPPATFQQVLPKFTFVAGAALVLVLIAAFTIQDQFSYDFEPADLTKYEFELPEKPSIAVLPFDNLSGDPANDFLGDGLTETIIAVIATSPDLFIIARNSVFTYRGKPTKVQQIAEELGVRYVMEGSVHVQDDRMRVVAQLVDALDGKHLWAEQYDYELTDIFKLQDDLTGKILEELEVQLTRGEQSRAWINQWRELPDGLEMFRFFVEGRRAYQQFSLEAHQKSEELWSEYYKRYPEDWGSNLLMGWIHYQKVIMRITGDISGSIGTAREFANRSLDYSKGNVDAELHILLASLDKLQGDHDSALIHVDQALQLSPGLSSINNAAAWIKMKTGQTAEGVELQRRAMRLEPSYSMAMPLQLAFGLMKLGQYGEANAICQSIIASEANAWIKNLAFHLLTYIAVSQNEYVKARGYVIDLLKINPNANVDTYYATWMFDVLDQGFVDRYMAALRGSGLPQNPPGN